LRAWQPVTGGVVCREPLSLEPEQEPDIAGRELKRLV
jgi:hypothetical protein